MIKFVVKFESFYYRAKKEGKLGIPEKNLEKVEDVLKKLELWEYRECHPMSLSGGQKQRVAIASALLSGVQIFCFDEPTSGMDYENMIRISGLIRECSNEDHIIFSLTIMSF